MLQQYLIICFNKFEILNEKNQKQKQTYIRAIFYFSNCKKTKLSRILYRSVADVVTTKPKSK